MKVSTVFSLSVAILCGSASINAFIVVNRSVSPARRLTANANDLFASDGWRPIQDDLDEVPIFTCANKEGKPLAYTVEMKDQTYTVPFFFCDVDDAQIELEKATAGTGIDGIGLIPFPLGKAFQMWAQDEAVIVPSARAIMQAGAPPGSNPIGQQVPLFACMEIMQSNEDGSGAVLPLFMDFEEANAAVVSAVEMDGGDVNDFEVVTLSLQKAIQLLATVPETPAFQFVASSKSLKYIQDYLA
ncbi:Tic22-like family [Fragilaria crotonensis]|nr:Tic22-like family [Fragilaria crotonensis]